MSAQPKADPMLRAQARVDRSYVRYINAQGCWKKAWANGFSAAVSVRNALKMVAAVRAKPEGAG